MNLMTTSLCRFWAVLAMAMPLRAAQTPSDVKLPDSLASVVFQFNETLVDAAGVKPTITRPKGSVEIPLKEIPPSITISVFNPTTKQFEAVTYSGEEIAALLKAIGEKRWLELNPPPLPVNRRSVREPSRVAATSTP